MKRSNTQFEDILTYIGPIYKDALPKIVVVLRINVPKIRWIGYKSCCSKFKKISMFYGLSGNDYSFAMLLELYVSNRGIGMKSLNSIGQNPQFRSFTKCL